MRRRFVVLAVLGWGLLGHHSDAASSLVTIEAVLVEPQNPRPDALCKLSVRLKNAGRQTTTYFRFKVKIDGQEVAIYKDHLYAVNIEPGTSGTIDLYSFWSPSDGKPSISVEVTLLEAQWAEFKREGQTFTTRPLGSVEGLPVSGTQSVRISATK
jgi:hypothetical protein